MTAQRYEGPFDREPWPDKLPATVVDARGERRIHGYAVRGDLADGHGIAAIAWLALVGELPSPQQLAALDTALAYLAPVHVGESGSHAALLARVVNAKPSALVAVAATALAEQGRTEREALAPWLRYLESPTETIPPCAIEVEPTPEAVADQRTLAVRSAEWFASALPAEPVLTRLASAHAILFQLGLRDPLLVELLAVWARLPIAIAEAMSIAPGGFRQYPARLPDYQYVDDEGTSI